MKPNDIKKIKAILDVCCRCEKNKHAENDIYCTECNAETKSIRNEALKQKSALAELFTYPNKALSVDFENVGY